MLFADWAKTFFKISDGEGAIFPIQCGDHGDVSFYPKYLFFTGLSSYSIFPLPRIWDRDRCYTETSVTLQPTVSLVPGVSPDTGMMVKEEPLEEDPLKTEMLVKIKGDPDEPEMVLPSSAATGTGRRNQYTSSASVRYRKTLFRLPFFVLFI